MGRGDPNWLRIVPHGYDKDPSGRTTWVVYRPLLDGEGVKVDPRCRVAFSTNLHAAALTCGGMRGS